MQGHASLTIQHLLWQSSFASVELWPSKYRLYLGPNHAPTCLPPFIKTGAAHAASAQLRRPRAHAARRRAQRRVAPRPQPHRGSRHQPRRVAPPRIQRRAAGALPAGLRRPAVADAALISHVPEFQVDVGSRLRWHVSSRARARAGAEGRGSVDDVLRGRAADGLRAELLLRTHVHIRDAQGWTSRLAEPGGGARARPYRHVRLYKHLSTCKR